MIKTAQPQPDGQLSLLSVLSNFANILKLGEGASANTAPSDRQIIKLAATSG